MENNINTLSVGSRTLPQLYDCNILTASDSFYHMDRTADFNVMIYVTDGTMYVTEDGRDYSISSGELLFLKKGLRHFGRFETARGTRWFYAHFDLDGDNDEFRFMLPKKLGGLSESVHEEKMYELCSYFHGSDPFKELRKNIMLCDLLIELCRGKTPSRKSLSDKICDFLDRETDAVFTKEMLENRFFLSYSHMAAQFKKEKGISMGQYHNSAKMKKACHLLRSTIMPVGEISETLGFADMLYFSKKFHAFSGMSPTEYRKKAQREY
ncbi:MAG: helix-turn-helix transcriptional regulator [Oscillospiraceae bacterium]|nr:helix-turn-helix transcriptional regulator [Oscillospiraceae bacterium]